MNSLFPKSSLIYLHGFRSSPAGWKSQLLAQAVGQLGLAERFDCPALSHVPNEAIAQIESLIERHQARGFTPVLIGSSLGGFYAHCLAEKHKLKAVLINPVVLSGVDSTKFLGQHRNFHTQEKLDFTVEHVAQLRALNTDRIDPKRFLLMIETGDEVLDYRQALNRYGACEKVVVEGGNHGFQSFEEHLPDLLTFAGIQSGL